MAGHSLDWVHYVHLLLPAELAFALGAVDGEPILSWIIPEALERGSCSFIDWDLALMELK